MKRIIFIALLLLGAVVSRSQQLAVKTNALFDAAMVPNLGVEVKLSNSFTANGSVFVGYRIYGQDMNLQAVSADLRYWPMDFAMRGLFVGLNVSGAHYDMTFSREAFMGDAIATGINIGWAFVPRNRPHWHFEVETVVGGMYYSHKHRWVQDYVKTRKYNQRGMLFMPYRLGVNVVYTIPWRGEVDSKGAKERRHQERERKRQEKAEKRLKKGKDAAGSNAMTAMPDNQGVAPAENAASQVVVPAETPTESNNE